MTEKPPVLERLAELDHEPCITAPVLGHYGIPYADLADTMKESHRTFAKKALRIMREGTSFDVPIPPDVGDRTIVGANACLVRSKSEDGRWYIVMTRPAVWCSCPSYAYRAPELCKHLIYVLGSEPLPPSVSDHVEEIARRADEVFGKG